MLPGCAGGHGMWQPMSGQTHLWRTRIFPVTQKHVDICKWPRHARTAHSAQRTCACARCQRALLTGRAELHRRNLWPPAQAAKACVQRMRQTKAWIARVLDLLLAVAQCAAEPLSKPQETFVSAWPPFGMCWHWVLLCAGACGMRSLSAVVPWSVKRLLHELFQFKTCH